MQKIWIKYNQVFDALSNRNRLLVLIAVPLIILILWQLILWRPVSHKNQETKKQIETVSQEIVVLQKQIVLTKDKLEKLKQQAKNSAGNLNNQPQTTTAANILPQKIVDTLKHLIVETRSGLNLIGFEASPVKSTTTENVPQQLLEHDMTLRLVGNYFATMSYIKSIEKLNWPIYWNYLSYKVTKYPQAEITLKIHTISVREE